MFVYVLLLSMNTACQYSVYVLTYVSYLLPKLNLPVYVRMFNPPSPPFEHLSLVTYTQSREVANKTRQLPVISVFRKDLLNITQLTL